MENLDITKYLDMALRRKWWIIIPFLVSLLGGLTYILITPKIYGAQTLILVQSQKVPQDFVRNIISTDVEDRLRTISQQVLSRTNLERIIKGHHLISESADGLSLDDKVELVRQRIKIDISKGGTGRHSNASAFSISFQDHDPKKAMEVTNALASNYISENLKIRESQALGTSGFLADELDSVKINLMKKEEQLKIYREKFMGGLPEQLETNLRILERLQAQVDQLHSNLRDAENRKIIIQKGLEEAKKRGSHASSALPVQSGDPSDLVSLKNKLASLEARYTEKHPDVIRLKKMIDKLEPEEPETSPNEVPRKPALSQEDNALIRQLNDIQLEINSLKNETGKVKSQIKWYQTKVEETPKREQELLSLQRNYSNLKELYNSLLNRKLEAEIAVSMEKKQKGEQFRVIDPAKIPTRPIEPDVRKIILMTLALGLGLGGVLAYLTEIMDTSYKTPDDVEKELDLPILISMPIRYTDRELKSMKRKRIMAYTSVGVGFVVSAVGIVLAVKGVDATINYIKDIFDKI